MVTATSLLFKNEKIRTAIEKELYDLQIAYINKQIETAVKICDCATIIRGYIYPDVYKYYIQKGFSFSSNILSWKRPTNEYAKKVLLETQRIFLMSHIFEAIKKQWRHPWIECEMSVLISKEIINLLKDLGYDINLSKGVIKIDYGRPLKTKVNDEYITAKQAKKIYSLNRHGIVVKQYKEVKSLFNYKTVNDVLPDTVEYNGKKLLPETKKYLAKEGFNCISNKVIPYANENSEKVCKDTEDKQYELLERYFENNGKGSFVSTYNYSDDLISRLLFHNYDICKFKDATVITFRGSGILTKKEEKNCVEEFPELVCERLLRDLDNEEYSVLSSGIFHIKDVDYSKNKVLNF